MLLHYCPQCGSKLQPGFKFCPACGEKLPCPMVDPAEPAELAPGPPHPAGTREVNLGAVKASASSTLTRSPIRTTRRRSIKMPSSPAPTPVALLQTAPHADQKTLKSPRKRKTTPDNLEESEPNEVSSPQTPQPSQTPPSPSSQSLPSAKGRGKRAKRVCAVEPVQEGTEVCDQSGKKWRLVKLLYQTEVELTYEVQQASRGTTSDDWMHILRMGTKDGQMFVEQNFLQRAAKPIAVEKWMKKYSMDFLGIPACVGFGIYETYRFLIFPDMGQTLQSVVDREESLPERAVLQLAIQLLDALEFIHENEYAHADLHAGNIYVTTNGQRTKVFLSGFGHAFRFCPGGNHVEYRESSRTPHQGNLNFISVDSHKGVGPSRRSDVQSLGYCLLSWMTGTLPWGGITQRNSAIFAEKERYMSDIHGLMSYCFKKRKVSGALQCYLTQAMGLNYTEKPNYSLLKTGLNESLQKMGGRVSDPLVYR
ncbi:inactive serine/threonine-protein kinase VRK3 isoform X2 [Electrophorus electricus]|uniref:Protein kinase domain-containing protein n=1 Tax=Electrophorus electricus TaxID=8005 RepID=A0A4W4GF37_ELEEL|nr:inactive serine/threonine-protein kinase VRK3 isoform X2 [Electrophorus electricus]